MVLSAGATYLDVLPNMSKFGPATAAGVQKSTAGLGSKLKSSFGTLGLVLGATFAIGFVKSAFADFQIAEKSVARFNDALERTGQQAEINADSFNEWLKDFALEIGKDDDAIRDLTTKLVNAFDFTKLPGDPQETVQGVTESIINMSAATGLAETRLSKMFLSILNDPGAAVTQLQKLGIVTEAEADNFVEMAEAGDDAAVTMELLAKVSDRYQGAAAASATESEKMSAAFGEFKETMGGIFAVVLKPLIAVFTALFRLLAGKPALIYALAGSFTVLAIAMKRVAIGRFFTNLGGAAKAIGGLGSSVVGLATSLGTTLIPSLTGAAAAAAGLGAALVIMAVAIEAVYLAKIINDINTFNNEAEDADARTSALTFLIDAQGRTVDDSAAAWQKMINTIDGEEQRQKVLASAIDHTTNQLETGRLTTEDATNALLGMGLSAEEAEKALLGVVSGADKSADAVGKAARAYHRFAGMSKKVFSEWSTSISVSFGEFVDGATSVRESFSLTTHQFAKNLRIQARVAERGFENLQKLMDLDTIGEPFKAWLLEKGPDYISAFVNGNARQQGILQEEWKVSQDFVDRYGTAVGKLDNQKVRTHVDFSEVDDATQAAEFFRQKLLALDGLDIHTTIHVATTGGGNTPPVDPRLEMAHGGIVTRPTIALIGEAGPEAVIPLRDSSEPMTLRILDWRNGIARLGDEIDWDDGGRP